MIHLHEFIQHMGQSIQEWTSKVFKDWFPQNLLSSLLNTLSHTVCEIISGIITTNVQLESR